MDTWTNIRIVVAYLSWIFLDLLFGIGRTYLDEQGLTYVPPNWVHIATRYIVYALNAIPDIELPKPKARQTRYSGKIRIREKNNR